MEEQKTFSVAILFDGGKIARFEHLIADMFVDGGMLKLVTSGDRVILINWNKVVYYAPYEPEG